MTETGYDYYELLSALQKDIRRGKEYEALHWAVHLEQFNTTALWSRLEIIASEDIGVANPILSVLIRILRKQYEDAVKRPGDSHRIFLSNAIVNLCRSKKSRVADDLLWVVYPEIEYEDKRLDIPDYALDHHTRKGNIEKWDKVGSKLVNEADIPNPYTEQARINLKKYKILKKESRSEKTTKQKNKGMKKANKATSGSTEIKQSTLQLQ